MFSEQLEEFIEAALADGVLTDKKREILHKRAIKEGVDVDELDMVLDARLAKMKTPPPPMPVMNNTQNAQSNPKPKNEFGITESIDKKIQMILEDGEISDEDRQYIHECAKEEGVSEKDVDFYINRLIKKQQKQKSIVEKEVEYEKKKKEAIGNICPKCGKQIPPMSIACPYCGTKVVNKKANSSVQELQSKLEKIYSEKFTGSEGEQDTKRDQRIRDAITIFPVPNTKEDIIEFLALAAPNSKSKGGLLGTIPKRMMVYGFLWVVIIVVCCIIESGNSHGHRGDIPIIPIAFVYGAIAFVVLTFAVDRSTLRYNKIAQAWRAKFNQVLMKGRSIQGDAEFQKQLDVFEKAVK